MKKFLIILLAVSLCLMAASLTLAADTKAKTTPSKTTTKATIGGGNLGIGWYDTSSSYGLSLNYKLSDTLAVQGVLAPLGWPSFYGGKINYKFMQPDPSISVYGYGMAGLTSYVGYTAGLGFGGGAGAEYFPGKMFDLGNDNYKKVGFMVELGLSNMVWNSYDWKAGFGISFNAGAHYYF